MVNLTAACCVDFSKVPTAKSHARMAANCFIWSKNFVVEETGDKSNMGQS